MKEKYYELYDYMSQSKNPDNMKVFGKVMNNIVEWMIANKPDIALDDDFNSDLDQNSKKDVAL